jgi:hypothetical protein
MTEILLAVSAIFVIYFIGLRLGELIIQNERIPADE